MVSGSESNLISRVFSIDFPERNSVFMGVGVGLSSLVPVRFHQDGLIILTPVVSSWELPGYAEKMDLECKDQALK